MEMLLAGKAVPSVTGRTMNVLNPANGEIIDTVPRASEEDVKLAIEAALRGRTMMAEMPAHQRSAILLKAAELIQARHEELSRLLSRENGKTIRQCRGEMTATQRLFVDFGEEAKRLRGEYIPMDTIAGLEHMIAYTIRKPLGVVVGIVPFNYPAELFAHKIPGAIAAGNSVIIKTPEQCPLTVGALCAILYQAGLPGDALQLITGSSKDIGDLLITHPEVAMISFTGSVNVAKNIAKKAADTLKRTTFELGGLDAMIVLADADLDAAAAGVVAGRLTNGAGQICCAVKRIFVDETVFQPFVDLLLEKVKQIKMGDPLDELTDLGPLTTEKAAEKVHDEVTRSIAMGAKCLAGGKRVGSNFYEPTVLVDVNENMPCLCDEIFGPVAPIVPFSNLKEAIAMANSVPFGLQASVYSENIHNALGVAHKLDVGGLVVNGPGSFRPGNLPFGGVKLSGIGTECITATVHEMSHPTAIVLNQRPI